MKAGRKSAAGKSRLRGPPRITDVMFQGRRTLRPSDHLPRPATQYARDDLKTKAVHWRPISDLTH